MEELTLSSSGISIALLKAMPIIPITMTFDVIVFYICNTYYMFINSAMSIVMLLALIMATVVIHTSRFVCVIVIFLLAFML